MQSLARKLKSEGTFLNKKLLKVGQSGFAVSDLQKRLRNAGYDVSIDGAFGPATKDVVIKFQKDKGLSPDGIAGRNTLMALNESQVSGKYLTQDQLLNFASELEVDIPTLLAVPQIESRCKGFLNSGKPIILYERHIMYRTLPDYGIRPEDYPDYPGLINKSPGGYTGYESEWVRLENAMAICKEAAYESTSWGITQIMGFHWDALGFKSPSDFVRHMAESEINQMDCFVRFLKLNPVMFKAFKEKNAPVFAHHYNGPAYAKNEYDKKFIKAIEMFVLEL